MPTSPYQIFPNQPFKDEDRFVPFVLDMDSDESRTVWVPTNGAPICHVQFTAYQDWGSGRITLEQSLDEKGSTAVPAATMTTDSLFKVQTHGMRFIRARVSVAHGTANRKASVSFWFPPPTVVMDPYAAHPPGTIIMFAGVESMIPDGFLKCDGSAVSRSQYRDLFRAVGTSWGVGDGSTTFNLPPSGHVFAGVDETQTYLTFTNSDNVGGTGGSETKTEGQVVSVRLVGNNITEMIDTTINVVQPTGMVWMLIKY